MISEIDLALAFLSGVATGVLLDRWVLPPSLTCGSIECVGMVDERDDDAERRRAGDYSSARIGAAAALTIALVVLLVLHVAVPDYHVSPGILLPLLGAILALLGLEDSAFWKDVR